MPCSSISPCGRDKKDTAEIMASDRVTYKAVKEDEGRSVRDILKNRMNFSSRLLKSVKFRGEILLNGKHVTVRYTVREGDVLTAEYPEEESFFKPEDIPIDVVYEDGDIMLVNKQAGLIVHPTYNFPDGTLANAIAFRMQQKGEVYKLRFVNRLDMYTSGLVIVAKNAHAQDSISRQMQENTTVKNYIAVVHGIMEGSGTIDEPIDKDPGHIARRHVTADGYPSVTHWEVLKTWEGKKYGSIGGFSLIKLKLDTGRTHQIRVHLSYIGHPIVGDELYGQLFGYDVPPEWMKRQALHAAHLELDHPVTGERICADAPLPEDMEYCIDYIENCLSMTHRLNP